MNTKENEPEKTVMCNPFGIKKNPPKAWAKKDEGKAWIDAHWTLSNESGEAQEAPITPPPDHSWLDVTWDEAREKYAKIMLETSNDQFLSNEVKLTHLDHQAVRWDTFYTHNKDKAFKNRNYLSSEFPELKEGSISNPDGARPVVLAAGCGVGNEIFPLLPHNPDKYFIGFDCSEKAIQILKSHPQYDPNNINAFVCDMLRSDIPSEIIPDNSVDAILLIFVLSAIPPEHMLATLKKLYRVLKPGGWILMKDYGLYDLTQLRFERRKDSKLAENHYVRGDGTFTYYFSLEFAEKLFLETGLRKEMNRFDTRLLFNRKRKLKMYRVWIRSKFRKPENEK